MGLLSHTSCKSKSQTGSSTVMVGGGSGDVGGGSEAVGVGGLGTVTCSISQPHEQPKRDAWAITCPAIHG